ncbi:kinetochore-associated Ndc80 complex subunit spc25 [Oleoguttula sp. CCFEE 6159]|nr:kinetochore-associated Ndc80 complex subunit spc25 [Oleoguttula sp. CCFEE 6159]
MATMMGTPGRVRFDSSLSGHHSHFTTDAPSMADSLPSVSFGFEDLRDRMARFTMRFDEFIEKGRKRVLDERNAFKMNVAELQEDQRARQRSLEIISLKTSQHSQNVQKESQETAEMHAAISQLTATRDAQLGHRDQLKLQIADVQKSIKQCKEAQQQHARELDSQARHNIPELSFWQDYLCLRIEGAGVDDQLKFVFTHIDDKDWEKECWFELGMGSRDYEVLQTRPKLERDGIEECLDRLNETRELGGFLKAMRGLFAAALK